MVSKARNEQLVRVVGAWLRLGRQEVIIVRPALDDEMGEVEGLELGEEGFREHFLDEQFETGAGADGDEGVFVFASGRGLGRHDDEVFDLAGEVGERCWLGCVGVG